MSKLTKQDWDKVKERATLFTSAKLKVDGYDISITMVLAGMKVLYAIYVNGRIKGEWFNHPDYSEEARRFYPTKRKYLVSPQRKAKLEKTLGKRNAKRFGAEVEYVEYKGVHHKSFTSVKKTLLANNKSIEIIEP